MMNREPSRTPAENMNEHTPKNSVWKRIWSSLIHNWGWKLLSVALAICLWGVLISQDGALPRDKVIDNVPVAKVDGATVRSNGKSFIVVDGQDGVRNVSIRVRVPQKNYPSASVDNYTVELDLSQIQSEGEQTVRLKATAADSAQYGTVLEVIPSEITVQVETYITQRQVPVQVRQIGEAPEGCYPGEIRKSADYVYISGPQSVVNAAVRCVVEYDLTGLDPHSSPHEASLSFTFEDQQGNTLDSSNLTGPSGQKISDQRIRITQNVYYMAQAPVDVSMAVAGQPKEGFAVKDVGVTPAYVTLIADQESAIAPYREEGAKISPTSQINITGKDSDAQAALTLFVPENITVINAGKNNSVQVTVEIQPDAQADPGADGGTE